MKRGSCVDIQLDVKEVHAVVWYAMGARSARERN